MFVFVVLLVFKDLLVSVLIVFVVLVVFVARAIAIHVTVTVETFLGSPPLIKHSHRQTDQIATNRYNQFQDSYHKLVLDS